MFLRSLRIKGFKSFADTTELEMEPGVTVVVGPNGSGKSNVVDAVGWVLGAQAPSVVRSQKMDDVIFAGTAKRASLGRAEVALTIDNTAGLLPVEFTEVTISRTLFRTGESEYAINGVPCRLLDIQELLSDTGVGRQQHVIVSQGQIDGVLNARPEDRRAIIEEAAGVLKFRRRREKATRRLDSTEANLTRLQDLLREVRRQLRPLERQAEAARRHGELVEELGGLRVYVAGRELARLREELDARARDRREVTEAERDLRRRLGGLDSEVMTTESRLADLGGDDLGDTLARAEGLRERGRGLVSVLTERARGIDRERGATIDRGVVATWEAEARRLSDELAEVEEAAGALEPERGSLEEATRRLEVDRSEAAERWPEAPESADAGAAEVRGELGATRDARDRDAAELERTDQRLAAGRGRHERLAGEIARVREELDSAASARPALAEQLATAERDQAASEEAAGRSEEARRGAEAEAQAQQARVEALELGLADARASAGADALAGVDGFLGTLLELVEVDEGYQDAFEAAAGAAVTAGVLDGPEAARRALTQLAELGRRGSVVPLDPSLQPGLSLQPDLGARGVPGSGASRPPADLPGEAVRNHVQGRDGAVDAVLDRLVGTAVVVSSRDAAIDIATDIATDTATDIATEWGDPVVVTHDGDRFDPTGWRIGGESTGATGAALEAARERAEVAVRARDETSADREHAEARHRDAQRVLAEAARAQDRNDAVERSATGALERLETDRGELAAELDSTAAHRDELAERLEGQRSRVAELEARLGDLEAVESAQREQARAATEARRALDDEAARLATWRHDLEVREAALAERRHHLTGRRTEVEDRLARWTAERSEAESRRDELDERATVTGALLTGVETEVATLEAMVGDLRDRRRRQSEAARAASAELDELRQRRASAEAELGETRERVARAEREESEVRLRIESHTDAMRRDLDTEPARALAAEAPELAEGVTAVARVRELERELRVMGPINPLALEEHTALTERHEFLRDQLDDVKSTRRDLNKVIRGIDAEIVNSFSAAFADVSANFASLFATLFPGGTGRLTLTDPEDLLSTGVEIEARPSGKNVKKLSLLSGGERSLTALAYLFSIFRARPSPFYVMDEVEAALDDVNLARFLELLAEFRRDTQLIVVSHQKRTMEAADCLYGVTMEPGGSSRVVSERIAAVA